MRTIVSEYIFLNGVGRSKPKKVPYSRPWWNKTIWVL